MNYASLFKTSLFDNSNSNVDTNDNTNTIVNNDDTNLIQSILSNTQQPSQQSTQDTNLINSILQPGQISQSATNTQNTNLVDSVLQTNQVTQTSSTTNEPTMTMKPIEPINYSGINVNETSPAPNYNETINNNNIQSSNLLQLAMDINKHETGKNTMDWGFVKNIGDGAGWSIGFANFTQKSGIADKIAKELGFKRAENTPAFKQALASDRGKQIQLKYFEQEFIKPIDRAMKKVGVYSNDPKVKAFLIDTATNGGLYNVLRRAKKMPGGITLENLKKARIARYKYLAKKNPKRYKKYLRGWIKRVNEFT